MVLTALTIFSFFSNNAMADDKRQNPEQALHQARKKWVDGEKDKVVSILDTYRQKTASNDPYLNDSIYFLLAMAHQNQGNHLIAEDIWRKVWKHGRSLSKRAYFNAAENALQGGFAKKTITYCGKLQAAWPKDPLADECILLNAKASMQLSNWIKARKNINAYLKKYPKTPRREVLELDKYESLWRSDPKAGEKALRKLYLQHSYATTDKSISSILSHSPPHWLSVEDAGDWAWTLQKTGHFDESWDMVQTILNLAKTSRDAKTWVDNNYASLAWRTRRYPEYVAHHMANYKKKPTAQTAWRIYRGYVKGGDWVNASIWGNHKSKLHSRHSKWAKSKETRARVEMYQRKYQNAARIWSQINNRKGKFYTGFCAYMEGNPGKAVALLEKLGEKSDRWGVAAKYWSGRSNLALNRSRAAQEDFNFVNRHDSVGWYSLLINNLQSKGTEHDSPTHTGRWIGPKPNGNLPSVDPQTQSQSNHRYVMLSDENTKDSKISQWQTKPFDLVKSDSLDQPQFVNASLNTLIRHDGYKSDVFGSIDDNKTKLKNIAIENKALFPELLEALNLAEAGQYPEAAQTLEGFYYLWKKAKRFRTRDSRAVQMRRLSISEEDWTRFFIVVRCHYQVYKRTYRLYRSVESKEEKLNVKRLNHPLPRQPEILNLAQQYDFDPFLFWGLLRQESSYREFVKSPVGAIGYVQVMPNTGARIADILDAPEYSPKDLENPAINLKYGAFYFSKLMERFDNAFPFAVGSYNGGPHNMSRWYRDLKGHIEMDAFVEHVAFKETRNYIKKVTGHYARYVKLYGFDGGKVNISSAPALDDPNVIDF